MNPIAFALRRPVTILVGMVALIAGSILAYSRMKVDIFPALNLPVIYVAQPYGGMDPAQMEGLLANYYEYHFLYIGNIDHVESKNVQGTSLMKLYFHPGTDMAQAMAETIAYVNRARAFMPPGTVPPFVMRFDTGSVPVGYLVLSSDSKTIGEIQDQALFKVRPMFAAIAGVSAPPPFGGSVRTIVIRADPDRLRACQLSPEDVVKALTTGNTISPSGAIRVQEQMPIVPVNSMVVKPAELGKIHVPVGTNRVVMIEDIAARDPLTGEPLIEDSTDIPTGYALVNGRKAVYILVTKRAEASTLDVVSAVKANLPKMQGSLPPDIKVSFEFDQSPFVTNSMRGVVFEGLLGAILTGLMVLVFLRDWRSMIVVVLNIPLALGSSLIALWLSGQSVNLMTLGGLALAVGILVDESTVEVENIHTQMDRSHSVAVAVRRGNAETAVPRLLAMLCILAVFLPSFLMQGAAQALFVPLSLAVGFALIGSYLLSSTLVPVLSVWLLKRNATETPSEAHSSALSRRVARLFQHRFNARAIIIPIYLAISLLVIFLIGPRLGTDIFPAVESHQFQLRLRAPSGTRIEQSEEIAREALRLISEEAGTDNVTLSVGYVGLVPAAFPINNVYHWSSGPEEVVLRVAFKSGIRTDDLKTRLRTRLADEMPKWLAAKWRKEGVPEDRIASEVKNIKLSFEPSDIINSVMSFGSPTPVEIVVSGPNLEQDRTFAEKIRNEMAKVDSLRDLQIAQTLDYPTVDVQIDRARAGRLGVTAEEISRALLSATSSSRFVVPNYWRDPGSGVGYQVQVEVPRERMNSAEEVKLLPVKRTESGGLILVRDVAEVKLSTMPGEYDRYQMRRLISLTANIQGQDLGRVSTRVSEAIKAAGEVPAGVQVDVRGQVAPLEDLFWNLRKGLLFTVGAILLLLTAYFQSLRLALVAVCAVPAVMAGVVLSLWLTQTTLNLQSYMGSIMAIGVAVANAILLVTFAEKHRREGMASREAAIEGVRGRIRPILMTGGAMIAGMVPMALAFGEGGEQTAPLGRAVIGGLAASMVATLLVLPAIFALVMGRAGAKSPSLDPHDPESKYFEGEKA
jgi:multidrug efflux pump subunit AcrB